MMLARSDLEPYACDFCRVKKLRCSRERPKCGNCRPFPGPCAYSRLPGTVRHGRKRKPSPHSPARPTQPASSDRISRLEESISTLTTALRNLTQVPHLETHIPAQVHETQYPSPEAVAGSSVEEEGELPSAMAFISEASNDIIRIRSEYNAADDDGMVAQSRLSDLSNVHIMSGLKDSKIRMDLKAQRRLMEPFYIPSPEEGAFLIKLFLGAVDKGAPIMPRPPSALVNKLAFEPTKVQERGWVLIFNCILASAVLRLFPSNGVLHDRLRWNTWLALDDAELFLHPSMLNIVALFLLAAHGESFSTPNSCWTLMNQACRMAQTLGLNRSAPGPLEATLGAEEVERRRILFWALFAIDKALSLTFGRRSTFATSDGETMPLPAPSTLALYAPHTHLGSSVGTRKLDGYGPFHFLQFIKLSKVTAKIYDTFYENARTTRTARSVTSNLLDELNMWHEEVVNYKSHLGLETNGSAYEDQNSVREIILGFRYLTFLYHHHVVLITRTSAEHRPTCISSARSAIALLDGLVSHSESVYNGIVWLLLYYPFTSFFAIFSNLVAHPFAGSTDSDLACLHATTSYLRRMQEYDQSAVKLVGVAEAFTRLAQSFVNDRQSSGAQTAQDGTQTLRIPGMAPTPSSSNAEQTAGERYEGLLHPPAGQAVAENGDLDPAAFLIFSPTPSSHVPASTEDTEAAAGSAFDLPESASDWEARIGEELCLNYSFDWVTWDALGQESLGL